MKLRVIIALSSAALLTLVLALVSSAGPPVCPPGGDTDSDGACEALGLDNCTAISNPGQRDDDEDGYGNICDADVNQDCGIGAPDITGVFSHLSESAVWIPKNRGAYDINEDNGVGAPDITAVFSNLSGSPGPSSRACADCTATPLGTCP
jgi:hypothetical protein